MSERTSCEFCLRPKANSEECRRYEEGGGGHVCFDEGTCRRARLAVEQAVRAERERCELVAARYGGPPQTANLNIAAAIRAGAGESRDTDDAGEAPVHRGPEGGGSTPPLPNSPASSTSAAFAFEALLRIEAPLNSLADRAANILRQVREMRRAGAAPVPPPAGSEGDYRDPLAHRLLAAERATSARLRAALRSAADALDQVDQRLSPGSWVREAADEARAAAKEREP